MRFFRIFGIFIGGAGAGATWPLSFLNGPVWLFWVCFAVGLLGGALTLRAILFDEAPNALADPQASEGRT